MLAPSSSDRRPASSLELSDMAKEKHADPLELKRRTRAGMRRLHGELVAMQEEWVKASGAKICIGVRGRDTAGKGARSSGSPSG